MSDKNFSDDDIDPFDQAAVRKCLLDIERVFNKTREKFYHTVQLYFRQSMMSDYTNTKELEDLLHECERLKLEYRMFKNHVENVRKKVAIKTCSL